MNKLYNLASEVSGSGKHVLYWDYDEKSINEDNINLLVSKHKLNLHIIKTLNGFHFIDFHLFTIAQIEKIQKDFYIYFPSTYPTIKQIKKLDDKREKVLLKNNQAYPISRSRRKFLKENLNIVNLINKDESHSI